jgi:predicted transcriptional regulator YheO
MESVKNELDFLKSLMKGITALFGSNCEVVLHDHKEQPYESTIIAIENGHITGRHIGDCGTNLGLEVLRGSAQNGDRYNYATQTKNGRMLRSSSIYLRNSEDTVIGAMCINFDITDLMVAEQTVSKVCQNPFHTDSVDKNVTEVFASDVNDLMEALIQEAHQIIDKPVASMTREDKIRALKFLDNKGAFLIKKAGDKIAKYFDISKYTMYSNLENIRSGEE